MMQIQHKLDRLRTCYEDLILFGALCEREHRFNNAIARTRRRDTSTMATTEHR